jgi:crotonobetainyl-CoA:carnitine CoA-transferase CaiB-like acyl-CoA transferase
MSDRSASPLDGVVVADFTRVLAGPLCTMVLSDLGADVIKIERPGTGDDTRTWGPPFVEGDSAYFLSINRNKRSIALDLTEEDDLDVARGITDRADVLVENFRSGVMDDLGLGHADVTRTNPGLIYCSMPAFAFSGSRDLPGYDLLMQAISGFMSITGERGREPVKMGVAILDVVAGLYAAVAILGALRQRGLDGTGRKVEVGLFEASVATLVNQAANYLVGGTVPSAYGNAHPNIVPYQAFHAIDGRFVLAAANDKLFRATCVAMGRPDLAEDARYSTNSGRVERREELIETMASTFRTDSVARWVETLVEAGVPAAPTRSVDQVFASPEGASMVTEVADPLRGPLRLVRSPIGFDGAGHGVAPPPRLDEHGEEIRDWIRSTMPAGAS